MKSIFFSTAKISLPLAGTCEHNPETIINVMVDSHISWISLWAPFLEEAVEAAIRSSKIEHQELAAAASAIILSRASWEAFSNELIEQRSIDRSVKELSAAEKIKRIYEVLETKTVAIQKNDVWSNLLLISSIRNSAVHLETRSRRTTESPKNVARKLSLIGVIELRNNNEWENQVFCANVARWCCRQTSTAIESLERIQGRQFRPPEIVSSQIRRILAPLKEIENV